VIEDIPPQLARRLPLPPQLTRRAGVLGVIAFVLFGIISFRLWYLQVLTGPQNVARATANVERSIPLPAPRGEILDAKGNVMASTRVGEEAAITADDLPPDTCTHTAHPVCVDSPARLRLYRRLGRLLAMAPSDIRRIIDGGQTPAYQPAPIADDIARRALVYLQEHARAFPGVSVQPVNLRAYPHTRIGGIVLGQIGPISKDELRTPGYKGIAAGTYVGQAGLEAQYNGVLQGAPGVEKLQVDAAGFPTGTAPKVTAPTAGENLQTSISYPLEREGYIAVDEAMHFARLNHKPAKAAAFFAMNPNTGRVLAVGSVPTYDPSLFVTPPSTSAYDAVLHSGALNDLATDGLFPTGSTFKPITALAGLQRGRITAQTLQGAGSCLQISTVQFCNSGRIDYGDLDLVNALAVSEDTYFYKLGAELNCATCSDGAVQTEARRLGLGESPAIDLPAGGLPGLVPDGPLMARLSAQIIARDCHGHTPLRSLRGQPGYATFVTACAQGYYFAPWTIGQNVGLATGQGYLEATPMQMAVAYSAIVNGGTVWEPKLAEAIRSPTGALLQTLAPPVVRRRVSIDPSYRQLIMDGLHQAAQGANGTSDAVFGNFPRTVYGKTGTAVHNGQADQSWYVCYVPDGSKSIVVAVTVEQGGFGAAAAAPAARLMLSQWFGAPKKWNPGSSPDR
jgi:penicillin-binding protein 2